MACQYGTDPDPEDLLAWVAERVAPHKRLRAIRFAGAIPRTPSGKLLRRALRDRDQDRQPSSPRPAPGPAVPSSCSTGGPYDTGPTAGGPPAPRSRASSALSSLPTRIAMLEK